MLQGEAQALLGGSGDMLPWENFGKMEPNPAILCILAVKLEWLQHGPLTKSTQKLKKIKFRSVERTLWPRGRVLLNPPNPPWVRACVRVWNVRVTSSACIYQLLWWVLTRARTKNHLNALEAVYISVLNPVLCKQESFATSLTLFQHTHTLSAQDLTLKSL